MLNEEKVTFKFHLTLIHYRCQNVSVKLNATQNTVCMNESDIRALSLSFTVDTSHGHRANVTQIHPSASMNQTESTFHNLISDNANILRGREQAGLGVNS